MRALAHIRPPGRSYADWLRFLEQCREAGVGAIYRDKEDFQGFATPLGFTLLRRWRWVRDSVAKGLEYDQAELAFDAGLERDKEALIDAEKQQGEAAAKAREELTDTQREYFDHAKDMGLL